MKSFEQYLFHSQKTYGFRIKLAEVDMSEENLSRIKSALEAYGVENMGKPKRLPIQEHVDFPRMGPCECHIIDVELRYPTTTEQLTHIVAERALLDKGRVCVKTKDADDLWHESEALGKDREGALLDEENLGGIENAQQVVGQARVGSLIKELSKLTRKYEVAGKEKVSGETTNSLPMNTTSPVGSRQNKIPSPVKGK